MRRVRILLWLACLLLAAPIAGADEAGKQYKYCFKVHFESPEQIQSATVSGYDHPWYRLMRPREIHSVTLEDGDLRCWKSELPEMGIGMTYTIREPQYAETEFRCRMTPDPMELYKAKTWNLGIKKLPVGEQFPVDCRIK